MLYLIATPIGNLSDISLRAIDVLKKVSVIACEDTRRTRALLTHFGIKHPMEIMSYYEHNESKSGERILEYLKNNYTVAFCSDSGYPGISDPGYRLVRMAIENNINVEVIPGPSAVLMALVLSGLPTSSFTFKGYPPRRSGSIKRFFEEEKNAPHTLVLFESPFRIKKTLESALTVLGNRYVAMCSELTKKFERVHRSDLVSLIKYCENTQIRGEVTLVIAGNNPKFLNDSSNDSKMD